MVGKRKRIKGKNMFLSNRNFWFQIGAFFLLFLQLSELGDFATDVRSALLRSQGIIGLMRGWEEDKEG